MSVYKFETSFPFPIVKVTSLIQHTEVSKPTGISYIILVLINESANKRTKLSDLLLQFGVPYDLHGIFADEIYKLIHDLAIIQCAPYEYNRLRFSEYLVGNFVFTEKGKKVFKEELIPASKAIESKQEIFYDPVHNLLMEKIPTEWKLGKIDSSILPNQLGEKFEYNDLVSFEDYLNSVKGKGIVIKKEEVIVDVKIISNEYFYTTFPVVFSVDNEKQTIDFEFSDKQTQTFFEANYDNKLISDALAIKKKFKFKGENPKLTDSSVINRAQLLLPEQYEEVLNKSSPLVISKSNYLPKQTEHVIRKFLHISKLGPQIETIHIYGPDKILAYAPVWVSFHNKYNKGLVSIYLLAEYSLNDVAKQVIIEGLFEEFKDYSIDHVKEGLYVFKLLNDREKLVQLIEKYLSADIEKNISILKEIRDTSDIAFIKDWYLQKANEMFNQYFGEMPLNTLDHQFAYGGWLIKYLNIPDISMINKIVESNPRADRIRLFVLLESLNYALGDIFSQVNVVDELLQTALSQDKINITGNFSNLIQSIQSSLYRLKELTNIEDSHQFVIKEDIDKSQYQEVFNGFVTKFNELVKFEKFGLRAFEKLKEYYKNFQYLNNLFIEEKNASSNPKNIDQKFIVSKMNKGDYFSAIIFLSAKLEWVLRNQYKLAGSLELMIDGLSEVETLKTFVSDLHQFRRVRNGLIHANDASVKINSNDLSQWSNIVFKEVMKI